MATKRRVCKSATIAGALVAFYLLGRFLIVPWMVKLHYVNLFRRAQEIAIRRTIPSGPAVTICRSTHPEAFARLERAVRNGYVKPYPCRCIICWELDMKDRRGSLVEGIGTCHYLKSPRQPFKASFWFYPRYYLAGDPDMPEEVERISREAKPRLVRHEGP